MTYDRERLVRASRNHQKRRAAYEQARDELAAEILAAANEGMQQKDIVLISQYTREAVRQLCMTPEQRDAEKEKRRDRTRRPAADPQ